MKFLTIMIIIMIILEIVLQIYVFIDKKKCSKVPGNADVYAAKNQKTHTASILTNKRILFLGSSVTYGAAAEGQSFVELFGKEDSVDYIKEAKSGTTLVNRLSFPALLAFGNGNSYIKRLKKIKPDQNIDCVVCQLSTNDATAKMPLGEISSTKEPFSFNTKTITGAIEYIIYYSKKQWRCPVVFYTNAYFKSEEYQAMVERLYELKNKWSFEIIDLYKNSVFNDISNKNYELYMHDKIHPTKAGYLKWWMPKMERDLINILNDTKG